MKPAPFEYRAAESVDEAISLLAELGDDAKVLAGGQSLIPLMNLRLARPSFLVDVNRIGELARVELDGTALGGTGPDDQPDGRQAGRTELGDSGAGSVARIGALVRQHDAERSALLRRHVPLLCEALAFVGHPQIRNRGTVGGSLAHADPAAELPTVVTALGGELLARGPRGARTLSAEDFFGGYFTTALQPDELLTEVRLPTLPARSGWAYQELSRRHGDFAIVGVAALLALGSDGRVASARLALSGVGPTPRRAPEAEQLVAGGGPSAELWSSAGAQAAAEIDPPSDLHGSGGYRRHVAAVLVARALEQAASTAAASTAGGEL